MMQRIWSALRSVLAVLAGLVALTVVAFAFEIPLHWVALKLFPETFPDEASLNSNTAWMLSQSLYTIPALLLGGYVAAWLAPHHIVAHAVAMAIVQEMLIVTLMFAPPHPVPVWMWAVTLIVSPMAIVSGGWFRDRKHR